MAGLPCFGPVACLTEPGIVHTALPSTLAQLLVLLRNDACYEAGDGVTTGPKQGKPAMTCMQTKSILVWLHDCKHMKRAKIIKVCGLTRAEDVALCEELGVDWIGFIFHPASPRNVHVDQVTAIAKGQALRVGVFVRQGVEEVCSIMDRAGLDLAQLHGGQDQAFCRAVGPKRVIKVFWPQQYSRMEELKQDIEAYASEAYADCRVVLLDAGTSGGGHGRSLDFANLRGLRLPLPWILAGGLGPENIREALLHCTPDGVDLNSGVEDAPGRKNRMLLNNAVKLIRG
jgi:phosphoribosylanthranilate isomerase